MIFLRRVRTVWLGCFGILAASLILLATATGAEARNVPGSVSAVQPRIDRAVAFSLLDTAQLTARDAATFDLCRRLLADQYQDDDTLRRECRWGISFGGGMRYIEGSPNGYDFDFASAFGSVSLAVGVSSSTTLIASLIAETGDGDLDFNKGDLENSGVGGLIGAIIRLDDKLDFSLIGGAEWLNYDTTRSDGLYEAQYDAIRYLLDAQLKARHDDDSYFIEYGGGLRLVHQNNDSYDERSGGVTTSKIPSFDSTALVGMGDFKLGTWLEGMRPYVQVTGYVNFIDDSDIADALDGLSPGESTVTGRFGAGMDADVLGGALSFTIGVFVDEDGIEGADGGLKFVKAFGP